MTGVLNAGPAGLAAVFGCWASLVICDSQVTCTSSQAVLKWSRMVLQGPSAVAAGDPNGQTALAAAAVT